MQEANNRPELEDSVELKINSVQHFLELIGVLRWAVKLGCIDIAMKVSMLFSHLALPPEMDIYSGQVFQPYFWILESKAKADDCF